MSEIEFRKFYEIALSDESLKNVLKRDSLKAKFIVDELDSDEKKIEFEEALVDSFNEIDKYKVYHVALFDGSKLSAALVDIEKKLSTKKKQIFTQPYVDRGIYELTPNLDDAEKTYGIMLFKDKIKSIRDSAGLIIREETYKILYMYRIDILKISTDKKCILISFPTYTERKGTTHYFNEEIQFVYSMFEGYGLILEPFDVKEFFNKIPKDTDLLTQGFHGRSVSGSGENDLPIEVKYKRDSDNAFEYQDFFRMIDSNICSEISSTISSKLLSKAIVSKENLEEAESCMLDELKSFGITESIIDEMKNYSKDGSGWLFYRQDSNQSVNIFSLIYNKMNKLQIRSTYEKWDRFKPLYEEIKKYITQS